ncbi:MAG: hypothetical protein PF482_06420 [Desulfobacteraceae bacterium]|nr:hypothetical protein [Desulfobacteraceae bacterium]
MPDMFYDWILLMAAVLLADLSSYFHSRSIFNYGLLGRTNGSAFSA